MKVITRFAPSPTGFLHIGGARTALFNYLFAHRFKGQFCLRIEDTDQARSTPDAVSAITEGLKWLGLHWDNSIVMQSANQKHHQEVALQLLAEGKAYYCDAPPKAEEELNQESAPKGPALRLKVDPAGTSVINDLILGKVEIKRSEIEDFVILRSDGTPTFNLACTVDDITMGITHVIRGNDHLTNTFKQQEIYRALGASIPAFAHIPLIHALDGSKLSKRHGALSVLEYKNLGYLSEAVLNYLMKLGWSFNNQDIITLAEATENFDLTKVQKSAAKFDFAKLDSINAHYLKLLSPKDLYSKVSPFLSNHIEDSNLLLPDYQKKLAALLPFLQTRFSTLEAMVKAALFIVMKNIELTPEAVQVIEAEKSLMGEQLKLISKQKSFTRGELHSLLKEHALERGLKLGAAVAGLRAALSGQTSSPASVFDLMEILGPSETIYRLNSALKNA